MNTAPIPPQLRSPELAAVCRRHGVQRLEVFGSAGTAAFVPGRSDIDLIVRFAAGPSEQSLAARFVGLAEALEALLGAPVDLMSDHPIANPYLRSAISATRRVVYDESPAQASV
jgi:predicted nucleotidyltransferase